MGSAGKNTSGDLYQTSLTTNGVLYSAASGVVTSTSSVIDAVATTSHTGVPQLLANGTAGYVLTAQSGAPPAWAAAAGGGSLVYISKQSVSNVASIDFTSIPVYDNYFFTFTGMSPSSDGVNILIRLSVNNGSSYIATGYLTGYNYSAYNSATITNVNTTTGFLVEIISTGDQSNAIYYVMDTQGASDYVKGFGQGVNYAGGVYNFGTGGGMSTNYTAVNAFRVILSSGNIYGDVTLYGIKDS